MKHKIVLVPFPFDDLSSIKVRPALCLTNSIGSYGHVVVAFITSQLSKASETSDLVILKDSIEFELTGLKVDSAVRLHRLVTLPINIFQKQLGVLPIAYHEVLREKLMHLFDI